MGYRLSKKELRIIERTKEEGSTPANHPQTGNGFSGDGTGGKPSVKLSEILKPYLFFILIFLGIALAVSLLVILTAR